MRTASTVEPRAIVNGRCAVHEIDTVTGSLDGSIHHPLKPPSTSCGAPRSPSAVDADHDSWNPSPSTSQHPSGQPSTVTSRSSRPCAVTVAVGPVVRGAGRSGAASTTRSTSSPLSAPVPVVIRCVPASSSIASPSHRVTSRASPASAAAAVPADADRHWFAVDGEQVVATPGLELRRHAGLPARRDLADRGRQHDRLGVAPVERDSRLDRGDLQRDVAGRHRRLERDRAESALIRRVRHRRPLPTPGCS